MKDRKIGLTGNLLKVIAIIAIVTEWIVKRMDILGICGVFFLI